MSQTVGKLVTEMALKDEAFRESLKRLEALAQITKSSLQDLSSISIDPEGNIVLRKKNLEDHRKELTEGEKAFKGYIAEQRLQDRAFKEGTNTILGITTALTLLTQGNDANSDSVKRIERSLLSTVVALNTFEFAMFSVNQLGNKLGGTIGTMISRLAGMAGPIGIVVGVGAGLISFFQETNEQAKKAADEGLTEFGNKLKELDFGERAVFINQVAKALANARKELEGYQDVAIDEDKARSMDGRQRIEYQIKINKLNEDNRKTLSDNVKYYEQALEKAKEANAAAAIFERAQREVLSIQAKSDVQLVSINAKLELLNQQKKQGMEFDENGRRIVDEILRLESERDAILEPTAAKIERASEAYANQRKRIIESQKQIAESSIDIEERTRLAGAKTEQDRIAIQRDAAKARIQVEMEYQRTLLTIEEDRINKMIPFAVGKDREVLQLRLKAIEDEKARLKEKAAGQTNVTDITANITLGEFPAASIAAQQQKVADLQRQLIQATDAEERRLLRERYDEEKALLEDLQLTEAERFQNNLDQASRVSALLYSAFAKSGDEFLNKLSQALQIAVQISKVIKATEAKGDESSPLDFLEIIGNVVKMVALFDTGGHTGYGNPKKPAGIVHADEIVFENEIVRNNRSALMALRSRLQTGENLSSILSDRTEYRTAIQSYAPRVVAAGQGQSVQDIAPLLKELRTLRDRIENLPPPVVQVINPITLGDGLRTEMPKYEKLIAEKNID